MKTLLETIKDAEARKIAIGHFNISDLTALKAIVAASAELNLPVIIGLSEGERDFVGVKQAMALIKSLREEYSARAINIPIYLNADHTYSLERIKEVVEAGFDSVIFDGAKLSFEENIIRTKEVVRYIKSVRPEVVVEGELGYIGTSSEILSEIPAGASMEGNLTKPEDAARFVKETGIDMLAPAVGNIHGMFKNIPEPHLDIERIKAIRIAAGVPLVLHGGSGTSDADFTAAINAGISLIHINTEIRLAWRKGIEGSMQMSPDEVAPYKLLKESYKNIYDVVTARMRLFNNLAK